MTGTTEVPMPGSCDPYYEPQADMLRGWLKRGRLDPMVVYPPPTSTPIAALSDEYGPTPIPRVLRVVRAAAFAPYVGRPFRYVWPVLIDDDGHYVAGDAEIGYVMDEISYDAERG